MTTLDQRAAAEEYCEQARNVLLVDYSQTKNKTAKRHYFKPIEVENQNLHDNKENIQNEIAEKLRKMNGIEFDFTEDPIDQIQDELDLHYDDLSDDNDNDETFRYS